MPITDWTVYKTAAGMQVALSATNPFLGDAQLRISRNGVGTSNISANLHLTSKPHGFRRGRLRTAYRLDTHATTIDHGMGLVCMQSQADLTQGSGAAYALVLRTSTAGGTIDSLRLVQYSAGLAAPTGGVVLATYATGNIVLATTVCLELEWQLDLGTLARIAFTARFQVGFVLPSVPVLPTVLTYVATTNVLSTSVAEGLAVFMAGSGDHASAFGETGLFVLP